MEPAWQNRMDIDASVSVSNEFPTSAGSSYKSFDPNKWTIMTKWECPILDFPNRSGSATPHYNFSSSVTQANLQAQLMECGTNMESPLWMVRVSTCI